MFFPRAKIWLSVCACLALGLVLAHNFTVAQASIHTRDSAARNTVAQNDCQALQGAVYHDLNGDGSRGAGEPGLGGISIKIKNTKTKTSKNIVTNADGTFLYPKNKRGTRKITVSFPDSLKNTTPRRVRVTLPACEPVTFGLTAAQPTPNPSAEAGTTYYLDCANGNDASSGTSTTTAWKSLTKANKATLQPGQSLLLKRGCAWTGTLEAKWVGTAAQPISIGSYGGGDLPVIKNAANYASHVRVSGSYQIIENLFLKKTNAETNPNCQNQPYGWYWGFGFANGASYNTVRNSKVTGMTAGVYLNEETHHNKILNNELFANNVMGQLDTAPNNDVGAWGINLHGTDNEIAYNYLHDNIAACSFDYGFEGSAIELFKAQRNNIHHNKSINDKVFSELGGDATRKAADNTFAYNLYTSNKSGAEFLVVTGYGDTKFGPVLRTRMFNNTIHLTHPTSEGVICSRGCSAEILEMRNNIIWAEWKGAFADGAFAESNNLFWNSTGTPLVQFQGFAMNPSSRKANPLFVDRLAGNFRLKPNSPAINTGSAIPKQAGYVTDYEGIGIWVGAAADLGIFEYH